MKLALAFGISGMLFALAASAQGVVVPVAPSAGTGMVMEGVLVPAPVLLPSVAVLTGGTLSTGASTSSTN